MYVDAFADPSDVGEEEACMCLWRRQRILPTCGEGSMYVYVDSPDVVGGAYVCVRGGAPVPFDVGGVPGGVRGSLLMWGGRRRA